MYLINKNPHVSTVGRDPLCKKRPNSGAGMAAAALCLVLALTGCGGKSPASSDSSSGSGASAVSVDAGAAPSSGAPGSADPAASDAETPAVSDSSASGASLQAGAPGKDSIKDSGEKEKSDSTAGLSAEGAADPSSADTAGASETAENTGAEPRRLKYIDAWKEWHTMEVDPTVRENIYDAEGFSYDSESGRMTYTGADGNPYEVLQGVDVSEHQGWIDWEAAAAAGYEFAFIRVGYRGYGEAGNVFEDSTAVENLRAAKAAGFQVGAYFFSQALSEEEAREEAAIALNVIGQSGVSLDLPLMYDPEIIKDDWGRANDITREQVALNTAAFREAVESVSPWHVDIYSNLPWEHHYFDADTLNSFDIWYADYERTPQTPYHFVWWQYTNEGSVPGMEGAIDLNLWIRPAGDS